MFDFIPQPDGSADAPARATGSWTVMDHVDIAAHCASAQTAIGAARKDAARALEAMGAEATRFRTLGVYWERKGEFVRCRAEVEALSA
ncbi:MAG: hypothetical protein AAFR46_08045 [Pseudomonadota bacterium]